MNYLPRALLWAFLSLVSACATVPFGRTELTPTVPRSAPELVAGLWDSGRESLMIRQSALFEFQGMRVPMEGVMKLDLGAKEARLVGMNDMGLKLYDISVTATSSQAHYIIPYLARYPGFAEAVAVSVRRIFLAPNPTSEDTLVRTTTDYQFSRKSGTGETVRFKLGGADGQLLEKSWRGPAESWRVRYYQYQRREGRLAPGGIMLDDDRAKYRLTLWIESVGKADE